MSSFRGIEIGRSAICAHQLALEVVGQNVANANAPGYSRQVAQLKPQAGQGSCWGSAEKFSGRGVDVERVLRLRDAFLDKQIRQESGAFGRASARLSNLNQIQVVLDELSDTGIRARLDEFWNAMQELSLYPENQSVRTALIQRAQALCEAFKHSVNWLGQLRQNVSQEIMADVARINDVADQIRELNDQIVRAKARGESANTLEDKRDSLIDEIAEFAPVDVTVRPEGAAIVKIAGVPLVEVDFARKLSFSVAGPDGFPIITWGAENNLLQPASGRLRGLLEIRDQVITSYIKDLDDLASSIVEEVNAVHRKGFALDGITTGLDLFTIGGGAAEMAVAQNLAENPSLIAASADGTPGDGSNAIQMAALKQQKLMAGGASTWDDFIRGMTARLGIETQEAQRIHDNQELLVKDLDNRRQSVSGVSLDEEATEMIKLQHAYAAAARLISACDELLDVLINRTGMVGR